jgi:hypothetical protein
MNTIKTNATNNLESLLQYRKQVITKTKFTPSIIIGDRSLFAHKSNTFAANALVSRMAAWI